MSKDDMWPEKLAHTPGSPTVSEEIKEILYNLHGYDKGEVPFLDAQIQDATQLLTALIHRVEVTSEIKGKLLAMDKMIMGAGEYHDDPHEYVVPIRHIKEYRAELGKFDLTQPIFRDKATLQDTKGDKS